MELLRIPLEDFREFNAGQVIETTDPPVLLVGLAEPNDDSIALPSTVEGTARHVMGMSATCTHMGCVLPGETVTHSAPTAAEREKVICGPCPCHGTTYDLSKGGLVVLGPATQHAPMVELVYEPSDSPTHLVGLRWRGCVAPAEERWPALAEQQEVELLRKFNEASVEELRTLPGLGAVESGKIVDHRPYATLDDVAAVEGIEMVQLAGIQRHVRDCHG